MEAAIGYTVILFLKSSSVAGFSSCEERCKFVVKVVGWRALIDYSSNISFAVDPTGYSRAYMLKANSSTTTQARI